jgi:hypothetical protein
MTDYRNSTVQALEIGLAYILQIRIISYMEIRTHFHLLCNYSQSYLLIKIPLPHKKKNPKNTFSFPTVQPFAVAVCMDKPKKTDISRYH